MFSETSWQFLNRVSINRVYLYLVFTLYPSQIYNRTIEKPLKNKNLQTKNIIWKFEGKASKIELKWQVKIIKKTKRNFYT